MNFLPRFLRVFSVRRTPPEGDLPKTVSDVLDSEQQRFRSVDPDTARQWSALTVELERARTVRTAPRRSPLLKPAIAFAVGGTLLIVIGVLWLRQYSTMVYETRRGQQSSILLSDSSEVTMNHTSELTVIRRPFDDARRMSLKGEAYFRVRRTGTPFIVSTEIATIQVLGTEFNVRVRDNQIVVAVIRGSVRVSVMNDDHPVVLTGNQILSCARGDVPGTPQELPFAEYPGWTHGKFLFYRATLLSACQEIESQFDVTIRMENQQLPGETITGMIDGRTAETALSAIAGLTGKNYRHEQNVFTLY